MCSIRLHYVRNFPWCTGSRGTRRGNLFRGEYCAINKKEINKGRSRRGGTSWQFFLSFFFFFEFNRAPGPPETARSSLFRLVEIQPVVSPMSKSWGGTHARSRNYVVESEIHPWRRGSSGAFADSSQRNERKTPCRAPSDRRAATWEGCGWSDL